MEEGNKKIVKIKEQVIRDCVSGLTIEFRVREDGESRLCLSGSTLPFGNREIHFDQDGDYVVLRKRIIRRPQRKARRDSQKFHTSLMGVKA